MPGLEGTRLGRYRLLRRLGRGGMSEVYLANDELMHREVALKVVSSTHTEYIERFQREAEAIGNLQHDHILPAFDYGEQAPWHYLVMPYIEHRTLFELLEQGPLSLEDAGILLQQIADGLQYAHDHGVIHRDIKPSNILLGDDRYAYLADFGLAKPIEGAGKVTQTGVLLGTPEYMAPELADGPASKSSDIYALGILLYQMVTGRTPFTADTALAVYLKQMREQPIPPSRINPAIPHAVDLVILRALDKDPRRRYETPLALAQAYMRALNQGQSQSPPAFQQTPMLYETAEMESELPPSPTLPAQPRKNTPAFTPPLEPLTPVGSPQQDKLYIPAYPSYPPYHPESPPVARYPAAGAPGTRVRPTPTPPRRHISADRRKRRPGIGLTLLVGLLVFIMLAAGFYVLLHLPGSQTNLGPATPGVGTTNTASVSKTPTRENFTSAATTPMPALRMSSLSPEPLAAPSHPTTPYSSSPGVGISNSLSMAPSSKKFRTLLIAAGRSALLQEPSLPQRAPMPASPTSQSTALHSTTLPGQPLTVRRGEGGR